jgi:hypothetical protein
MEALSTQKLECVLRCAISETTHYVGTKTSFLTISPIGTQEKESTTSVENLYEKS